MLTGKGYLNLRDGHKTEVSYQFAADYDGHRAGYLHFDTAAFDDISFCRRLIVDCDDGSSVVVAVLNRGDKHLAVTGRVLALPVITD
ncbi:hypothetical protein BLM15_29500 (plasmid) [Bosea sp. Tri-49]|uniref:hypothetical protein n=1 Tax=unclassified Bosea (in: a-proteobacteria) TaxID=2653178 RepID=UPI000F7536AA|nr:MULTISPECIES: hypothetical protein [unclassified Bosea (in: a-proteobacteria)]AZO81846.1 hypothetical protein BLM15_28935 [Bosea sp. Tri-49]AZO81941.1 hypothetical protein BLM15_29500 [Bosea sp. Tri-49]RXT55673.1 hypothetical protein B6S44_09310 [Bosea sp. Tri-44]